MFNSVGYSYDRKKKIHTFTGFFGSRLKNSLKKVGLTDKKMKYFFIDLSMSGFSILDFFILDLKIIIERLMEVGSVYDINFKMLNKVLAIIQDDISSSHFNKFMLNHDALKRDFKFEPYKSQLPAYEGYAEIRSLSGNRGMLLDGAVGVGKTYISLTLASMLNSEVTLILAPLPTIERVWVNSLAGEECLYRTPQEYYNVSSSDDYSGQKYIIAHYENLDKIIPLYKKHNINFTTVIVDEVHNFNDIKSVRTKLLMDVVTAIPFEHSLPMSGTPIKAKATDLIPLFKIISTDFDRVVEKRFQKLYSNPGVALSIALKAKYQGYTVVLKKTSMNIPPLATPTVRVKTPTGGRYTLAAIGKRMRDYVDKRTTELETKYDYYAKVYKTYYHNCKTMLLETSELSNKDFLEYENSIDAILTAYSNNNLMNIPDEIKKANLFEKKYLEPLLKGVDKVNFRESKTVYKYISLKVQGEALANIVMRARIDCYTELVNTGINLREFTDSTIKKTIVFSNYIEVCDAVTNKAKAEKLTPITVYGDTSKFLTRQVNVFLNNKDINPLVATYKSLSTGVPLIAANVIVIFGLPYRQYIFDQAVGRAWRTGQDLPVTVYIVELDTGDEPNITDRDFDIIDFFRTEVRRLTGKDDTIIIDRNKDKEHLLSTELGIEGLLNTQEDYFSNLLRTSIDILTRWTR